MDTGTVRYLRLLVTILTATMIAGFLVIVALFVIKFSSLGGDAADLPDTITLPADTNATAFTQGPDWYAVVTDDDRILIFDRTTGDLRQTVRIEN